MSCRACTRKTLTIFSRSLTGLPNNSVSRPKYTLHTTTPAKFFSAVHSPQSKPVFPNDAKPFGTKTPRVTSDASDSDKQRPSWQMEKEASKRKLNGEGWNPRKKLSPDTMEGIRHLHKTQPERFTTPVLAQHFKVSPEAIKRILKSRWQPTDEEQEDRMRRWDKRGEQIWTNLVELGVKPPKKWREMGVGRAPTGGIPKWKSRRRNTVAVQDSPADQEFGWHEEDLLPIVDGKSKVSPSRRANMVFSDRIGV